VLSVLFLPEPRLQDSSACRAPPGYVPGPLAISEPLF
jgi:hypothetical protein